MAQVTLTIPISDTLLAAATATFDGADDAARTVELRRYLRQVLRAKVQADRIAAASRQAVDLLATQIAPDA